jgi:hypothetical protein
MNDTSLPVDPGQPFKVGRLEELNGHGRLTGKLWEADGTQWTCHFKPDHVALLSEAWMHTVKLTGHTLVEQGKGRHLDVDSIEILDAGTASEAEQTERLSFWQSLSLEELSAQQGIAAVDNLDEISALWPADDDPDALLRHILTERSERRKLSARQAPGDME